MPPTRAERSPITVVGEFPGVVRVGMLDQLTVTAWLAPVTVAAAHELGRLTEDVIQRQGSQRFSAVHLIDRRLRVPDSEVRDVLLRITRDSAAHIACIAAVIDGAGFWASAIRSFITGLRVLAPRSFDVHVYSSIAEVVEWLPAEHERRTGGVVDPARLDALLQTGKSWLAES